jgi:hypothetical protein
MNNEESSYQKNWWRSPETMIGLNLRFSSKSIQFKKGYDNRTHRKLSEVLGIHFFLSKRKIHFV